MKHFFSLFRRNFVDNSRGRRSGTQPAETAAAETALAESERRYRDLIVNNPLGVQIKDRDGNRLLANRAMVDLLGYESVNELMAAPWSAHLPGNHVASALSLSDLDAFDSVHTSTREVELIRKDQSIYPVQVFRRVVEWGGQKAVQRTYVDLSDRQRAETALRDSERRYRDLFEASSLGLRITDANGNRVINQAMATLLGYASIDELQNTPKHHLIAPYDHDRSFTLEKIENSGGKFPKSIELDLVRQDGTILPVEIFWRLLEWEDVKAVERTYIDISARKESERAVEERNRMVQEMRHKLAHAFQISTMAQISTVIAHELHQPLAAINNAANAARRRLADKTADQSVVLDEMLPLIADQAERAGHVIRGIRALFEEGASERVSEDLNLIIEEACALASSEFDAKNVEICHPVPEQAISVSVDRIQIQQVIINLVRNATDALNGAPQKNITVSISKTDDETVQVTVHDNGPGLSPDLKTTLFEPFVTTKKKGMGMGLYACQQIIEGHGGNIWFEPDINPDIESGATISFNLPVTS